MTGDVLSLRRSLALHARARNGDNRTAGKRSAIAKAGEIDGDDELFAAPTVQ
jgi:hypothetical protein